jgi:hypothetical protein
MPETGHMPERRSSVSGARRDLLLQCTGGPSCQQIPPSNIRLTLNTNITSRSLGGAGVPVLTTFGAKGTQPGATGAIGASK